MSGSRSLGNIRPDCIVTSAAFSVASGGIARYDSSLRSVPRLGDLVLGQVETLGYYRTVESRTARIHTIHEASQAVFVFGNRYSPDLYEGLVPEAFAETVTLLGLGGVVGHVTAQHELLGPPTRLRVLGYVCDAEGRVVNSTDHPIIRRTDSERRAPGAKIILCIGTNMSTGKTGAAAACCRALSIMGKKVRAAKITGTASLKDILLMEDSGAERVADFTHLGYPSTYLLEAPELLDIFRRIDAEHGSCPDTYLVIEIADGILQRETAMLLDMPELRARIHKLVFSAPDACAVHGGLRLLEERFHLRATAISGLCSSSPLLRREIAAMTALPVIRNLQPDPATVFQIIE